MFDMYGGYNLVELNSLIEIKIREVKREVKRSWKERLFTRPWQPFKATKTIDDSQVYTVPRREFIVDDANRIIYAHPEMVKELQAAMEKDMYHFRSPNFGSKFRNGPSIFEGSLT